MDGKEFCRHVRREELTRKKRFLGGNDEELKKSRIIILSGN